MDKLVKNNKVILIGYSGHAYVVADTLLASGEAIIGYCDKEQKVFNPFILTYLGQEQERIDLLIDNSCFIGIGNNFIREKIYTFLFRKGVKNFTNAIHPSAIISNYSNISTGVLIAPNAIINALALIGKGVICNTSCIIEHECKIEDFAHIAPGATLAGNVEIGKRTFIGANSVIKQGIKIGNDVTVGAGSVVIRDVPNGFTVVGNPARTL